MKYFKYKKNTSVPILQLDKTTYIIEAHFVPPPDCASTSQTLSQGSSSLNLVFIITLTLEFYYYCFFNPVSTHTIHRDSQAISPPSLGAACSSIPPMKTDFGFRGPADYARCSSRGKACSQPLGK